MRASISIGKFAVVTRFLALAMSYVIGFSLLASGCDDKGKASQEEKKTEKAGASEKSRNKDGRIAVSPDTRKNVRFKSVPLTRESFAEAIEVTATIVPNQNRVFNVTPRIRGRVIEVNVSVGSAVGRATRLALLDSTELGEVKAEYVKAKTLSGLTKANYEREKSLFEQKISAQKDMLAAEAEYRRAEAEVRLLSEKLRLYGFSDTEISNLDGDSHSPSHYYLLSPSPGIVTEKDITVGEVVESGKKVFTVSDLSVVWTYLDIYERDLAKIKVGQNVTVRIAAYPERQFTGRVTYLSDVIDEKTRTIKARVEIKNPDRLLKPGMFAEARIETGAAVEKTMTVPKEAVFLLDEGPVAFIEKDGEFFPRRIETGKEAGGRVEIRNGLSEGEKVVVEGGYYLKAEILKSQMGEE